VNWLILNFGYHNAHHAKPTTPWFDLPTLHRERFGDNPDTVIRLWPQLVMYHRYRRYRIFHDAPGLKDVSGKDFLRAAQSAQLTGGNAASFLTSF
jgi:fatty acid desaturase